MQQPPYHYMRIETNEQTTKLFKILLENILENLNWENMEPNISGEMLNHLSFADNLIVITDEVPTMLVFLSEASNQIGFKINYAKTKQMMNLVLRENISMGEDTVDQVLAYKYLE